jgi:hypothetical protein
MQNGRLIGSALAGCAMLIASFVAQGVAAQETKATVWPSPDWQTASPEDEGIDSKALAGLVAYGRTRSFDSLLIARAADPDPHHRGHKPRVPNIRFDVIGRTRPTYTAVMGVTDQSVMPF